MVSASFWSSADRRAAHFSSGWIGRSLQFFGMGPDVVAAITGAGIEPWLWTAMQRQVPVVRNIRGIPVILPDGRLPTEVHSETCGCVDHNAKLWFHAYQTEDDDEETNPRIRQSVV